MEGFQKIILTIAVVILIVTLVFMGIVLRKAKGDEAWPPIVPACPDWWILDGSGNNSTCVNVKDLGTCSTQTTNQKHQTMNFNEGAFAGSNGVSSDCSKYNWAKKCQVSWDGITYGVENPCSTTSST
jgi:hypothetical protein